VTFVVVIVLVHEIHRTRRGHAADHRRSDQQVAHPVSLGLGPDALGELLGGDAQMHLLPKDLLSSEEIQCIEGIVGRTLNWPATTRTRRQAVQWLGQEREL